MLPPDTTKMTTLKDLLQNTLAIEPKDKKDALEIFQEVKFLSHLIYKLHCRKFSPPDETDTVVDRLTA